MTMRLAVLAIVLCSTLGLAFGQESACGAISDQVSLPTNTTLACDAVGCTVRCMTGFFTGRNAPQMIYACVDGAWVTSNPDITCPPVECGTPAVSADFKEILSCTGTTFNNTCSLRCTIGYDPRAPQTLVCADDGKWIPANGAALVKCTDQDGCANSPCAPTVSVCQDIPAPATGYVCKCAPGFSGSDALIAVDGKGCVRMGIETKGGDLNIKVGVGKSITFQRGDRVDSIASIVDRLTRAEALSNDIAAVNSRVGGVEASIAVKDSAVASLIATNTNNINSNTVAIQSVAQSVSNLVGPTGQVNINKQNIITLQSSVSNILAANGPIATETSRATAAENSVAASVNTLSTRVNTIDTSLQSTITRVTTLQTQLTSEISRATSVENSLAAGAATISTRVGTLETSQASTALRLSSVDTAQQSTAARVASVDSAHQSTVVRVNGLEASLNNEITRAVNADSSIAVTVDDVRRTVSSISCASPASVSNLDTKYTNTEATNLNSIMQIVCAAVGATFVPALSTTRCYRLGEDSSNPALSCVHLRDTTLHGKNSGVYFINFGGGSVFRTYCDQVTEGGGWELILKIRGDSNNFIYTSTLWTTTNIFRETDFDPNLWEDAKYPAYNVGRYVNLRARWNDAGGFFTWTEPTGFGNTQTPFQYFTTERVINTILSGSDFTNRNWMEWTNTGGRFSDEGCAKRRAIAHCTPSSCIRWGMHYNNECEFNSNDVLNGLGMGIGGRVAGDYIGCCATFTGVNRPMSVQLWARQATVY